MAKQTDLDKVYMQTAYLHAGLSKAIRQQVGAVLVTQHGVTLTGYNGTPAGRSNTCETYSADTGFVTKPEVIHAELNCVLKAAREGVSCVGSTVYTTLSPCLHCSGLLVQAGIRRLVFSQAYRDLSGIDLLRDSGVEVQQLD